MVVGSLVLRDRADPDSEQLLKPLMSNVLIRDVPVDDLEQIRSAVAAQGTSLQNYLLTAVRAQAAYLRRQAALAKTIQRLQGHAAVPEDERAAVLD